MLSRKEIDEHNAKVKAFWEEVRPRIEAISKKSLKSIYKRVAIENLNPSEIAREIFPERLDEWPQPTFWSVGASIYHRALVALGKYDEDYRPLPGFRHLMMFEEAEVLYDRSTSSMRVQLGDLSAAFQNIHVPRFGIDVDDMRSIEEAYDLLLRQREEDSLIASLQADGRLRLDGGALEPGQTHRYDPTRPRGERLTEVRKSFVSFPRALENPPA
jgi:hypothetical protein